MVQQPGETITGDYIIVDKKERTLDARGNCVYIASGMVIHSEKLFFNMDTRTGTITRGRVSTDRYSLAGEEISRLGDRRFKTKNGDYTTCLDCATSWTLHGGDVDMEFGNYGYLTDVITKVKDTPVFWVPYMVIPLKTDRQTGFLFPRLGLNQGFTFMLPFFWAINRSADMTVALGHWGGQGTRYEWEGRYQLKGANNFGRANFVSLNDPAFDSVITSQTGKPAPDRLFFGINRWGLMAQQGQDLPWNIQEKLNLVAMSDNRFPTTPGQGIPGLGAAYVASDFILTKPGDQITATVDVRQYRNLLNLDPINFDALTVQEYPAAYLSMKDQPLFGDALRARVDLGLVNFSRAGSAFDTDPLRAGGWYAAHPGVPLSDAVVQGEDPIRKATRLEITPSLYTTLRPFDRFVLVPSVQYHSFFYSFPMDGIVPGSTAPPPTKVPYLARGYMQLQLDLSTQLERIYQTDDAEIPKIKHLIRPLINYSFIPTGLEYGDSSHPFLQQIQYAQANGITGYNFDNYDIVPRNATGTATNYFPPLGSSMTAGLTSQLVRRRNPKSDPEHPSYETFAEFKVGQIINLLETGPRDLTNPDPDKQVNGEIFSRFFASFSLKLDHWSSSIDYKYYPYAIIDAPLGRNDFSASVTYNLLSETHDAVFTFNRSFNASYVRDPAGNEAVILGSTYSINDYFTPYGVFSYDLKKPSKWNSITGGLRFQSPSRCWALDLGEALTSCPASGNAGGLNVCHQETFNFTLNLTGSGFSSMSDFASSAVSH